MSVSDAFQDFKELSESLVNDNDKEAIYEKLMAKEENRIELLNRIVDERVMREMDAISIFNKPPLELARQVMDGWQRMASELWTLHLTSFQGTVGLGRLKEIFWDSDRKVYTGFLFVAIAIAAFLFSLD